MATKACHWCHQAITFVDGRYVGHLYDHTVGDKGIICPGSLQPVMLSKLPS